jgi:hypothetical protein
LVLKKWIRFRHLNLLILSHNSIFTFDHFLLFFRTQRKGKVIAVLMPHIQFLPSSPLALYSYLRSFLCKCTLTKLFFFLICLFYFMYNWLLNTLLVLLRRRIVILLDFVLYTFLDKCGQLLLLHQHLDGSRLSPSLFRELI